MVAFVWFVLCCIDVVESYKCVCDLEYIKVIMSMIVYKEYLLECYFT